MPEETRFGAIIIGIAARGELPPTACSVHNPEDRVAAGAGDSRSRIEWAAFEPLGESKR